MTVRHRLLPDKGKGSVNKEPVLLVYALIIGVLCLAVLARIVLP